MTSRPEPEPTLADHEHALREVAFLVDAFASTIDDVMGGTTGPIGRNAGRDMARKLPIHLEAPTLPETLAVLGERLGAGLTFQVDHVEGGVAQLTVGACFVRELCACSGKAPGGPACRLYHSYLDGIVNELMHRPVKSTFQEVGASCRVRLETQ